MPRNRAGIKIQDLSETFPRDYASFTRLLNNRHRSIKNNERGREPARGQAQAPKLHHAVFVSYSSDDEGIAGAVCSALEAEGIHCWMAARDVQGGRPYSGQITQAIREARVVLLVLSKASNRSKLRAIGSLA